MALVLLVGAGLMIRTLGALWRVDPGFNPNNAITFNLAMPGFTSELRPPTETRAYLRNFDDTTTECGRSPAWTPYLSPWDLAP